MSFDLINRRVHLYLGLFLLVWLLAYGLSSVVFNHNQFFRQAANDGAPQWIKQSELPYDMLVPVETTREENRELGAKVMADLGYHGSFFAVRPRPEQLNITVRDFFAPTRITFFIEEGRVLIETRRFQWPTFLTGIHLRLGYSQGTFLDDLWALLLDIFCLACVVWVASGIYMWWFLRQTRFWGTVALAGGFLSFLLFMFVL